MRGKVSSEIQEAVDSLANILCQSEEFKTYKAAKAAAVSDVDKLLMIRKSQELRTKINAIPDNEADSEYAERITSEYDELMEDTVIYNYTKAEQAVGRICNNVFECIIDAMEF